MQKKETYKYVYIKYKFAYGFFCIFLLSPYAFIGINILEILLFTFTALARDSNAKCTAYNIGTN